MFQKELDFRSNPYYILPRPGKGAAHGLRDRFPTTLFTPKTKGPS